MKTLKIAALFLAAAGLALPASAELKGKNEVSVQLGALSIEGDADMDLGLIYGARLGHYFTEKVSGEVSLLAGNTETGSGADVATLHPALAASYHFRMGKFMPFLQAGAGLLRLKPDGASSLSNLALHWGGGLKYFYKPGLLLRADLDHVLNTHLGMATHELEAAVGVSWLFGTAEAVQEAKKIIDPDSDRDGVADSKDSCPGTAPGVAVDARGCPVPQDADKDGITDDKDQCPATPANTAVDEKGCPLAKPDTDTDGVDDGKDECPGTAAGTAVNETGCPQGTKAIPLDNWVLKGVTFEVNSDTIKEDGKAVLDEAVAILLPRTSVRLEVQGHTDNTGDAAYNLELSEKRAAAVKAYLMDKGIAADRLEAKGYGPDLPVADNATPEGRDANRRIEFKVLSR